MAKKVKQKKTAKQHLKRLGIVLLCLVLVIVLIGTGINTFNFVSTKAERNFADENITAVVYDEAPPVPTLGDDGYYTFTVDRDFKILQLTDVHIGAGYMCVQNDLSALNAVAAMITAEQPDLVIFTGDVAYPIPLQAGTINNKRSAELFADFMEKLGVYWCLAFGNHDTELYSLYSRSAIAKSVYGNKKKYPHCLFQAGPRDIDGEGNYVINIRNGKGAITQSLFMLDSHSYVDGDFIGLNWLYDAVHENQVQWYKETVQALTEENGGVRPNSLAFFHIPLIEMKQAAAELIANGGKDTADVKYTYGKLAESDSMVCSGKYNYGAFDAFKENGTQGAFFGHDHLNNMSLNYKGVQLSYGYSIDYLAYNGINKYGLQRGCTVITVKPDGSFESHLENYYQDKYRPVQPKEEVIMDRGLADDQENAGTLFDFQAENNKD